MLPVFGPSDERDATGLVGDAAANPMTYFFPYTWIGSGVRANNFTDTVENSVRFTQTEPDSYSLLQYAWSFGHQDRQVDMRVTGDQDQPSLETLQSALFTYQDAKFRPEAKRDQC
jgi:ABC-type transporter lipoprotein component MlaA